MTNQNIRSDIENLKKEIQEIRTRIDRQQTGVADTLRRRGFTFGIDCPMDLVVYPPRVTKKNVDTYYELLKRYSFRIVLRDIIKFQEGFTADDLLHYCSAEKVQEYLTFLTKSDIIQKRPHRHFQLTNENIDSIGETLEWLVAQIFRREFRSIASWGVKVLNTNLGGDYDVIALVEQTLIYVETKSSPPKNIHQENIDEFLGRLEDLKPDLAIYLVDTHLRLEDKINKMFRWGLQARHPALRKKKKLVKRLHNHIFLIPGNIIVMNSKPDLVSNLAACLRYYFGVLDRKILW